ncbi:hypothetical protein [Suttonella ornithocola]|uniref:Phage terminase, small subunit n=1 Tax=Suttonella ornithocola TaxID=279832 RepID=A0A380MRQ5_9GAMM|nr:hypothetical protein [Suttonella ornithocola]SUO95245.1 Uncharacterised protein [Suttonella ornithocola]
MTRRKRSDSTAATVAAFAGASMAIEPPKPLTNQELFYWHDITRARAREDWTAIDLAHAWNLSKLLAYIEQSHTDIAAQGLTLINERGTPVDNPAISRLEKLSRLALSYSTKLHIHAEATVGKSEDSAKRATKQRKAGQTLDDMGSLIARPQ